MRLREPSKLLEIWNHAFYQGANLVLMRHAPKSGSDQSDLSEEGEKLARQYARVLQEVAGIGRSSIHNPLLYCTSKSRTMTTLKLLFPGISEALYKVDADLEVNKVSPFVQEQCNLLHAKIGHWRGYYLNHTYCFLEQLGGSFDEENLHTVVCERMVRGIRRLLSVRELNASKAVLIYCGHSPAIEVACGRLLNKSIPELGGFLNPLDSFHLKKWRGGGLEFVARTHVIEDYVDLESETYYSKTQ